MNQPFGIIQIAGCKPITLDGSTFAIVLADSGGSVSGEELRYFGQRLYHVQKAREFIPVKDSGHYNKTRAERLKMVTEYLKARNAGTLISKEAFAEARGINVRTFYNWEKEFSIDSS